VFLIWSIVYFDYKPRQDRVPKFWQANKAGKENSMKTQNLLKSIFGTAFIALLLSVVSCDTDPSAFVGRWVKVFVGDEGEVMELLSDGTGVVTTTDSKGEKMGLAIKWKTEKERFYVIISGLGAESYNYKLQGSALTFTDDNGKISKYIKCKKDCKEAVEEYIAAAFKSIKKGSFTDSRDGKSYKTVKLNNQTWMAENLNYEVEGSKCYGNYSISCDKYGRLYNWNAAKDACPKGWHLPDTTEWQVLVYLAGGKEVAGKKLKASSGWNDNGNGLDAVGFAALPGGSGYSDGSFRDVGNSGRWWSASEGSSRYAYRRWDGSTEYMDFSSYAYSMHMFYYGEGVDNNLNSSKYSLHSVRCVQD